MYVSGQIPYPSTSAETKVFCFFSSEKKALLFRFNSMTS